MNLNIKTPRYSMLKSTITNDDFLFYGEKILKKDISDFISEVELMISFAESDIKERDDRILELESKLKLAEKELSKFKHVKIIQSDDIEKIKSLRKLNYSYREISKEVGWSLYTISKVLNGKYD